MTTLDEALDRQSRATDPLVQAQRRQTRVVEQEEADVSTLRKIGRIGAAGIEGFNLGLAQMLAAPTDIINFLMARSGAPTLEPLRGEVFGGAVTGPSPGIDTSRFLGSSRALIQNLEAVGIGASPSQETLAERIAGRAGEEVGATVLPTGVVSRAARLAPIVPGAPKLQDPIIRPAVTRPARTAGVESGLAVSAGPAAGAALEVTEGAGPTTRFVAETTAQVAGGVAPGALVGAVRGGVRVVKAVLEPVTDAGIKRRAGRFVQLKAVDVEAALRRLEDLPSSADIPDVEFTGRLDS